MINGRHLLLLGILACAGLISVRCGQQQIELYYKIGAVENDLRLTRAALALAKLKHQALESPKTITDKAAELKLKVAPPLTLLIAVPPAVASHPSQSSGMPHVVTGLTPSTPAVAVRAGGTR